MKKIPVICEPKQYKQFDFCNTEFVQIKENEIFDVCMQYPLLGFNNALDKCLVRKDVYDMLCIAYSKLPKGYRFRILDAWRPYELQKELYIKYSHKIIRDFELEAYTVEESNKIIQKFVSEPVFNKDIPPVHTTGGAVDLTIIDSNGNELVMGTEFDEFTKKTYTAYFENEKDKEIKENRRLLFNVMNEAGFTNLPSEWWHYDYGDCFWAYYKNKPAKYRGVFTWEELDVK